MPFWSTCIDLIVLFLILTIEGILPLSALVFSIWPIVSIQVLGVTLSVSFYFNSVIKKSENCYKD